jgi:hypothetical protein
LPVSAVASSGASSSTRGATLTSWAGDAASTTSIRYLVVRCGLTSGAPARRVGELPTGNTAPSEDDEREAAARGRCR